jgi:hypothetical protein
MGNRRNRGGFAPSELPLVLFLLSSLLAGILFFITGPSVAFWIVTAFAAFLLGLATWIMCGYPGMHFRDRNRDRGA